GCAVFATLGVSLLAWGQDQSAALAKDAIFARKILMDTISNNMDELETMTTSGKGVNLTEGREHADIISVMLMAFPHLFAAETNQWNPNADRDPGRDTYASPDVFSNYADFYARAARASKIAYNASRAKQDGDFKKIRCGAQGGVRFLPCCLPQGRSLVAARTSGRCHAPFPMRSGACFASLVRGRS
ncbi:MAG: cytochrome c, partial [Pseudolabrys sp.]